jgi:hypothetical protein
MTKIEFLVLCGARMIDPQIALENESIREAVKSGDAERVRELLDSEF